MRILRKTHTGPRIWLTLALSFLTHSAVAQLTRGYVSGTIEDPSGAVVEAVTVSITNRATGIRSQTATSNAGVYRFAAVEAGVYHIEFSKAGFETRRVESIDVGTIQEVVLNQALAVASTSTTVDVREAPPGVELAKASATIDRRLSADLVEAMPLRDATALVWLTPLVVIGQGGNTSSGGQRNYKNNYTVDGIGHNNPGVAALVPGSRLLPEAVGEFHVQTAAYSAEYGRNSGAQVSAITRGGTNQWHGAAWDYFSSDALESRNLPDKRSGLEKRRLVSHDAGGSLGGPVAKNRTFFFALFENDTRRPGPSTRDATDVSIPTPEGFGALSRVPLAAGQTVESRQAMLDALGFLREVYPRIKSYGRIASQNLNGTPIPVGTA
ncbi:MAG: carboxypeptidase regulatory-like domain-containing protein, partial [Acidobacteria bacterium]|nr:carboxypeptidase regulatory-like domain-containing protein [Acidobacteriota bacterium]